jgi:hypothetical protein
MSQSLATFSFNSCEVNSSFSFIFSSM